MLIDLSRRLCLYVPLPAPTPAIHTLISSIAIGKYKPQDATTNPSLILAASKKAEYAALIDKAVTYAKTKGGSADEQVEVALDRLLVEFGSEILKIIPGKVSTEVDASLSFDTKGSVEKALHIIEVQTFSVSSDKAPKAMLTILQLAALQGARYF